MEQEVADALDEAGISYLTDFEGAVQNNLDFYLPETGVYLEVKGGHSKRPSKQLARAHNVILVQGKSSVLFFASLIKAKNTY